MQSEMTKINEKVAFIDSEPVFHHRNHYFWSIKINIKDKSVVAR